MLRNEDETKVLEIQTATRRKKPAFVTLGFTAQHSNALQWHF